MIIKFGGSLIIDFMVSIPSYIKYPALNISHAAAILFYELFKHSEHAKIGDNIKPASIKEKKIMPKMAFLLGKYTSTK